MSDLRTELQRAGRQAPPLERRPLRAAPHPPRAEGPSRPCVGRDGLADRGGGRDRRPVVRLPPAQRRDDRRAHGGRAVGRPVGRSRSVRVQQDRDLRVRSRGRRRQLAVVRRTGRRAKLVPRRRLGTERHGRAALVLHEADRQADQGLGDTPVPSDHTYGPGQYPQDIGDLSSLSTDPTVLLGQLRDRSGPGGLFSGAPDLAGPGAGRRHGDALGRHSVADRRAGGDARRSGPRCSRLRRVWRACTSREGATDPVGRPATLLATTNGEGIESEWWFDPTSEQLLAQRYTVRTDSMSYPNGTVFTIRIVAASGVTDSVDDGAAMAKSFVPSPVTDPPAMPDPRH